MRRLGFAGTGAGVDMSNLAGSDSVSRLPGLLDGAAVEACGPEEKIARPADYARPK